METIFTLLQLAFWGFIGLISFKFIVGVFNIIENIKDNCMATKMDLLYKYNIGSERDKRIRNNLSWERAGYDVNRSKRTRELFDSMTDRERRFF